MAAVAVLAAGAAPAAAERKTETFTLRSRSQGYQVKQDMTLASTRRSTASSPA